MYCIPEHFLTARLALNALFFTLSAVSLTESTVSETVNVCFVRSAKDRSPTVSVRENPS